MSSKILRLPMRRYSQGFVGPPDPVSNLRNYKYILPKNATPLEKKLYEEREAVQKWNHSFWTNHNTEFMKKKESFIREQLAKRQPTDSHLNADEMSVFYKKFLDDNWRKHFIYNFTWYRKNVAVTLLHFRVILSKLIRRRD